MVHRKRTPGYQWSINEARAIRGACGTCTWDGAIIGDSTVVNILTVLELLKTRVRHFRVS